MEFPTRYPNGRYSVTILPTSLHGLPYAQLSDLRSVGARLAPHEPARACDRDGPYLFPIEEALWRSPDRNVGSSHFRPAPGARRVGLLDQWYSGSAGRSFLRSEYDLVCALPGRGRREMARSISRGLWIVGPVQGDTTCPSPCARCVGVGPPED